LEILFKEFFGEEPSADTIQLSKDIDAGKPVRCYEESVPGGD
jgi:hypothetical protein